MYGLENHSLWKLTNSALSEYLSDLF
jgi:hypothetical protein